MLKTQQEIQLMQGALAPGMRDPHRPEDGAQRVLRDFFGGVDLRGARVLELGPGHFAFAEAFARAGAVTSAVDFDPVVVGLGALRGIEVRQLDLRTAPELGVPGSFDGLFCKGSINCFWYFGNEGALIRSIESMERCLTASGWAWVVGCPTPEVAPSRDAALQWLSFEREQMTKRGWKAWPVVSRLGGLPYGINFVAPELFLFTRNLPEYQRRSSVAAAVVEWCVRRVVRQWRRSTEAIRR